MNLFSLTTRVLANRDILKQSPKSILLVILISFMSVSCGKKGPLYLSKEEAKIVNKVPGESLKSKSSNNVENTVESTATGSTK